MPKLHMRYNTTFININKNLLDHAVQTESDEFAYYQWVH